MILTERIDALVALGDSIDHSSNHDLYLKAKYENPWFTIENIEQSIDAIKTHYINRTKLEAWIKEYQIADSNTSKRVGLILAGNIPLVGFHDIISVFLCGHTAILKLSDKDRILPTYFIHKLIGMFPELMSSFKIVDRLTDYDAVIATGSDSSGRVFEKYFSQVPHIIRRNRNGVAVITQNDNVETLKNLRHDLFDYFGLGCRNVSKVYIEKGVSTDLIFESIVDEKEIINHNKFKNNYDYSSALYLMNLEKFLTNDVLILREHEDIGSRIACLHYEYYDSREALTSALNSHKDKIQCVVSSEPITGFTHFGFGNAQKPSLADYADGVDTIAFLNSL
jgi:hypothetical protein